jgi:antitoxin component YwqK of YwqJK toxin-antitoxin module
MQLQLVTFSLFLTSLCACSSSAHHNKDPYSLEDTVNYKLTQTQQGGGGVFLKTETYVNTDDTTYSYVKVYSYTKKVAAVQFYKGGKKHGPTITYNENGTPQLGTYYRNDTVIDMHPFK